LPDTALWCSRFARSAERGIGTASHSEGLPHEDFHRLSDSAEAWVQGGPLFPRRALIIGSWFLLREIELAGLLLVHVELIVDSPPRVRPHLPVSKADTTAIGTFRELDCTCPSPLAPCPYHTAADQHAFASAASARFGTPPSSFPFFPTRARTSASKQAVVNTIVNAASQLQLPLTAANVRPRFNGHSLRATGAEYLARQGIFYNLRTQRG